MAHNLSERGIQTFGPNEEAAMTNAKTNICMFYVVFYVNYTVKMQVLTKLLK